MSIVRSAEGAAGPRYRKANTRPAPNSNGDSRVILEAPSLEPRTVEDRVAGLLVEQLDLLIDRQTDLFATGILDSLGFVTLLTSIEVEFGVTVGIDDLEIERFRTIPLIAEYVESAAAHGPRAGGSEQD
jgi:acyl carrier protein